MMKPRKPYTINLEAVDRLNKQGKTITEIASLLGHSIGGISKAIQKIQKTRAFVSKLDEGLKKEIEETYQPLPQVGKQEETALTLPPEQPLPPPEPVWQSPEQRYAHLSYKEVEVLYLDGGLDDDPQALAWFKSKRGPETGTGPRMPRF